MDTFKMPCSRAEQLVVQELPEETLVYDLDRHKAHCLNRAAAVVWKHCDGVTSLDQMSEILSSTTGLPSDRAVVQLALDQLDKAKLLKSPLQKVRTGPAVGRRQLLKRIGLVGGVALALPLVTSIIAPTAVSAATCLQAGKKCTTGIECCSGVCLSASKKCL